MPGKYWALIKPVEENRPFSERGFQEVQPNQAIPSTPDCNLRKTDIENDGRDPLQDLYGPPDKVPPGGAPDGKVSR